MGRDRPSWLRANPVIRPGAHYVRITTSCNNRCVFCYVDRTHEVQPAELNEKIARIPADAREVVVTGGEPTIDPDLFRTLRRIREHTPADLTLQTNGLMAYYPEFVERLESAGVRRVIVSCPAHEPARYKALTGGDFALFQRGLDNLSASGLELVLNALITKPTASRLPDLARWVAERFGSRAAIIFSTLIPTPGTALVSYTTIRPHLERAATVLLEADLRFLVAGLYGPPPCLLGEVAEFSETLLYLNPNVHGETGEERFTKAESCSTCCYDRICPGVWREYAERFHLDELEPAAASPVKLPRLAARHDATIVGRYRDVLERWNEGTGLEGHFVVFSVTQRCNCNCVMCEDKTGRTTLSDHFSDTEIATLCAELRGLGFERMLLCGGEPTLEPRLPELIRTARAAGFEVLLNTNGRTLEPVLDAVLDAGLDGTILSLDSARAEVHDRIRGVPGLFERVVACAERIGRRAGPEALRLHSVVMRDTIDSLQAMVALAARCGAGGLDLTLVFDAQGRDNRNLRPTLPQLQRFFFDALPAMLDSARELGVRLHLCPTPLELLEAGEDTERWSKLLTRGDTSSIADELEAYAAGQYNRAYLDRHLCGSCHCNVTIEHDGTVYPCARSTVILAEHAVGNLKRDPMATIWSSDAFRAFRRRAPHHAACQGCFSPSRETMAYDRILSDPEALLEVLAAEDQKGRSAGSPRSAT